MIESSRCWVVNICSSHQLLDVHVVLLDVLGSKHSADRLRLPTQYQFGEEKHCYSKTHDYSKEDYPKFELVIAFPWPSVRWVFAIRFKKSRINLNSSCHAFIAQYRPLLRNAGLAARWTPSAYRVPVIVIKRVVYWLNNEVSWLALGALKSHDLD